MISIFKGKKLMIDTFHNDIQRQTLTLHLAFSWYRIFF